MKTSRLVLIVLSLLSTLHVCAKDYYITDYGAKANGKLIETEIFQNIINEANANGGGRVIIPSGKTLLTGTIYLKSFVTIHIENGAILKGSPNLADYSTDTHKIMYKNESHMNRCFIFAKDCESIAIEGYGTIDGNGYPENFSNQRPMLMRFLNCTNIHMNDITLVNPAAWTTAWLYCNNIKIEGVSIVSRVNKNGDGLDFDGCQNVVVTNCNFDNSDDCICLQTSKPDVPCKNITINNCNFCTKWGGIRIGLLSRGVIESVTVTNCTFRDISDSGLKIQQCEGGIIRNMTFSNLIMENVPRPIFMTFSKQRACVDTEKGIYEPLDRMHNIQFNNIIINNSNLDKNSALFFTGSVGHKIEDVILRDIQFIVSGGGSKQDAQKIPKEYTLDVVKNHWPEFSLVGTLPASGIYMRHMENVTVENFHLTVQNEDNRKPVVYEDVDNLNFEKGYCNTRKIKL